ncbi:hypothetical protein PIB30_074818 [Stylosanthes scabra]|uniref:Uncharacterized protein n=1 Tax=Stylosanthes scabra TaxID=79078 RepID=A0ABU6ZNF4_9FABA|nr:hypothetical protein [Stylosanthes scabra]
MWEEVVRMEDKRQQSTQQWQWEDDEMLINAWLNILTDRRGIGICFVWSKNGEANYQRKVEVPKEPRSVRLEHTPHHQTQKHHWLKMLALTYPFVRKDRKRAKKKVKVTNFRRYW